MKVKRIKQSLIYILEISVIASLFIWLTTYLTPIENKYEILERFLTGIVVYQGLLFLFNRNTLDAERDMILAYNTYLKLCTLYLETSSFIVLDKIKDRLNKLNNGSYLINEDYLGVMNMLCSILCSKDFDKSEVLLKIKLEFINSEHMWEYEGFLWRQSLILKLLK